MIFHSDREQETNGSGLYRFEYEYDLAGGLTGFTNESTNRKVSTVYNNPVSGQVGAGTPITYVQDTLYAAHGGLAQTTVNPGSNPSVPPAWVDAWTYNSSLQMTSMSSNGFSLGYTYFTGNNGNVQTQTMSRLSKTWTQTYTYDGVNRLKTAVETGQPDDWSQTYDYTATGNRYVSASTNFSLGTFTASASTQFDAGNHLTISGLVYDDAGNQSQMGTGLTMAYDADGRVQSSTLNGLTLYYVYDADGHRVMKMTGPASTTYVYDAFGQLVMEVGGDSAPTCTTCFLTVDALGSTRQETDSSTGLPVGCHDYLPFGEELGGVAGRTDACWTAADTTLKFTGKQRDTDTVSSANAAGLDYFGARYFSAAQGRFTSPDAVGGTALHIINPQRWNMYAYGLNNPLLYTDPDGRDAIAVNLSTQVRILGINVGHAGIVSVHRDGTATYGREGPRSHGVPVGGNEIQTLQLPNVVFGADGLPTAASWKSLAEAIGGLEIQDPSSINFAYFKTSEADTVALDNFLRAQKRGSDNRSLSPYFGLGNNCADFCINGLSTARVLSSEQAANASVIPNLLFFELSTRANAVSTGESRAKKRKKREQVTERICFEGQAGCNIK